MSTMIQTVRERVDAAYISIRAAQEELAACRRECPHLTHKETLYSWRTGSISPALVCEECDAFIKYLDEPLEATVTVTSGVDPRTVHIT